MSKQLLIFTDIGDDIDDHLALTYLVHHTSYELCGIVLSHGNLSYRYTQAKELEKHL